MSSPTPIPSSLLDYITANVQLTTFTCSRQHKSDGYRLHQRVISDYNLIFVTRGRPVWVITGEEVALEEQSLLIVPPGVEHHGYSKTQRVTLLSIHLHAALPGGQSVFDLIEFPRLQGVVRGSRLDGYLRGALAEFDSEQPRRRAMMPGWTRLVFLELLHDNARRRLVHGLPIDPLVSQMLEELKLRVARPTHLGDLAQRAGYTAQHLNRVFNRALGVTPMQYLNRLRMEKAAQMLLGEPLTVAAVGKAVGFDDPYHFSRAFKHHFGHSPSEHRLARDSEYPSPDSSPTFPV
ncbi:MAG: helix-turn-helix domain-containing protein [Phycisphaera sp.]|nr:helix-turn-helix domain-containing protein [Phycisphaera sp.]